MRLVLMATIALVLTACGPLSPTSSTFSDEAPRASYVRVPLALLDEAFVLETGFARDHAATATFALGWLPETSLAVLSPEVRDQIVILDEELVARSKFDIDNLQVVHDNRPMFERFEDYHDYEELTTEMERLASEYPEIATLASAGQSVSGRELWYMKISDDVTQDEDEPKLLYIANMHGDETVGRELMVYLIRDLLAGYGTNERLTALVDHAQIFIMPSMNPDGFEVGRRGNARGYDLNRDFPDFTSDPNDSVTGRQPETQAVMRLHAEHHFVMALNFHGGAVCFNMPWDTKGNRTAADRFGDDPLMSRSARAYADANPTMRTQNGGSFDRGVTYGYEWYEVDGGLQDWANYYRHSIHATIELSSTKYPDSRYLDGFWGENKEPLIAYLEAGMHGFHLKVTDEQGLEIANPAVQVSSAPSREVPYDRSTLSRPSLGGQQSVTISAAGFEPVTLTLDPEPFRGEFREVRLTGAR